MLAYNELEGEEWMGWGERCIYKCATPLRCGTHFSDQGCESTVLLQVPLDSSCKSWTVDPDIVTLQVLKPPAQVCLYTQGEPWLGTCWRFVYPSPADLPAVAKAPAMASANAVTDRPIFLKFIQWNFESRYMPTIFYRFSASPVLLQ